MSDSEKIERQFNVLVFGLDRIGATAPDAPLAARNFTIHFETYKTARRFNEYDGVIVFQGIFERFKRKDNYMSSYLAHEYDADELDKRKKEAALLLSQGGFICFPLTSPFIDHDSGRDFRGTDLAKYHLNYSNFYRKDLHSRIAHVTPTLNEFKRFLELYGAANTSFENYNHSLDVRPLAKVDNTNVGLLINRAEYFVPSLVPDNRPDVIAEYFQFLVDAVTSVHNKLHQEIPEWVAAFKFNEESSLDLERSKLLSKVAQIDSRLRELAKFKATLVHTGSELVADVTNILESGLGVKVDNIDQFREDIKILGEDGKTVCVCEIKGINRGVGREHINQTDSHRERSGYDSKFPALLIANTNIKSARSIQEKDQEIAPEQVAHAVHMNVLVMRTLDLLGLLHLVLNGKLSRVQAQTLILSNCGWLQVQSNDVKIRSK